MHNTIDGDISVLSKSEEEWTPRESFRISDIVEIAKVREVKIHFRNRMIRARSYGYCAQPDIFSVLTASQFAINI